MFDQAIGVLAHLEEIRFLFRGLDVPAAIGALALDKLALRPEGFARGAIHTFVIALVNVALVVEFFEHFTDLFHMVFVGGADEFVVRRIYEVPNTSDLARNLVHVSLRRNACGFC